MSHFTAGDRVSVNIPGTRVQMLGTYVGPAGDLFGIAFDLGQIGTAHPGNVTRAPYVIDPARPTDAELSAAITRGLGDGSIVTLEALMGAE